MKRLHYLLLAVLPVFNACIGDDILEDAVPPALRILNPIDSLALDSSYAFTYRYTNEIGVEKPLSSVVWKSSNPAAITITENGLAKAIALGQAVISVQATLSSGALLSGDHTVMVGKNTAPVIAERTGTIRSTSSYELKGGFVLKEANGKLVLTLGSDYRASSSLPGLYVYLSNNPNSSSGAFEIGRVSVFSGAHSYTISNVGLRDYQYVLYYCKPFNVKVGHGEIQ